MGGLRILITNNGLAERAGSELYVRDLATALLRLGHRPVTYSARLGEVAAELREATVPVIDDLDRLADPPDLIHGQHHVETMTALLRFPGVPAVSFCHGWIPWEELPPRFPRIRRYVAVDDTCRDRLVAEAGIPPERVQVVLNFVDLDRFRPRPPLPPRPARALVFSNYAHEGNYLPEVRRACAGLGIALDVVGRSCGNPCPSPEALLGAYDLVFAKGRAALEALATGAAVVVCDTRGCGPLVREENLAQLRRLNFGIRTLAAPVTAARLVEEIRRYDAADAGAVTRRLRAEAGRDDAARRIVALYEEVLREWSVAPELDRAGEARAAAAYLREVSPALQERSWLTLSRACERLHGELLQTRHTLEEERAARGALAQECDRLRAAEAAARAAADGAAAEAEGLRARASAAAEAVWWRERAEHLQQALSAMEGSLALRLRHWALRVPLLGASARYLLRGGRGCWRGARRLAARLRQRASEPPPAPFIVGVARSGTTLLRLMLDAHPQLAIPAETGFIPPVADLAGPPGQLRQAFFDTVTAAVTWEDLTVAREEFWAALAGIEPFTVPEGVRCFYRLYAHRHGKARWGDKTPGNGIHLRTIQQVLPEARFLHIVRDGRDVAVSLRGLWFSPGDTAQALAQHWRERIETVRAQAAGCRHYLEVRYEDLLREPRRVLRRVCAFLDLPFARAMEKYHRTARQRLDEVKTRYKDDGTVLITKEQRLHLHRFTQRRPDASRIGRWKEELSPADVATFERVAGGLLRELGYSS